MLLSKNSLRKQFGNVVLLFKTVHFTLSNSR